ncbi:MAG: Ig-like domain-containing protein, partial [Planctomycetota bacterium]
ITVVINDNGNTGVGGGIDQTIGVVNVDITAVNDAPVNTVPGIQTVAEETTTAISGLSISDVDAGSSNLTTRLQVSAGTLNVTLSGSATMSGGSNGSGDLTIQGSVADINSTLASLTYTSNTNVVGTAADTLTMTTNDLGNTGTVGPLVDSDSVQIDITGVNDTPDVVAPGLAFTVNEQTNLDLHGTGFSVTDVDAASGVMTASFSVGEGLISLSAGDSGIKTVSNNGSNVSFTGMLSQINDLLTGTSTGTIVYNNPSDTPSANTTVTLTVNDAGNTGVDPGTTGDGTSEQDSASQTINITAVNDDPTNAGSLPTDIAVTEDVLSSVNLSPINFADIDAGSSSLTVTLSTSTGGELTLAANGSLTFGGSTTSRTISGSIADLNTYFDNPANLRYLHGTPGINGDNADTITVVINDNGNTGVGGGIDQTIGVVNVDITAVNDAPDVIFFTIGGPYPYQENDGAVSTVASLMVSDRDDTHLESATVQIVSGYNPLEDVLSFVDQNGISGSYDNTTGTWTLTGTATVADYQTALRSITYTNTSENPDTTLRTLRYIVNDGQLNSAAINDTIQIERINDDPINAGSLPSDITVTEDVASNIDLSTVTFNDVDADSSSLTVTLATSSGGQVNASTGPGITLGGTAEARTFTGSIADLNSYFSHSSNITYIHAIPGTFGENVDTINVVINDNGHSGTGGGTDQNFGSINVDIVSAQVNQAPVAIDDSISVDAGSSITLASPGVLSNDVDPDGDAITAELVSGVANGVVSLSPNGAVVYTPNAGFFGQDAFRYRVTDGSLSSEIVQVDLFVNLVAVPPLPAGPSDPVSPEQPEPSPPSDADPITENNSSTTPEVIGVKTQPTVVPPLVQPPTSQPPTQQPVEASGDDGLQTSELLGRITVAEDADEVSPNKFRGLGNLESRLFNIFGKQSLPSINVAYASHEVQQLERMLQLDLQQAIVWTQWENQEKQDEHGIATVFVGSAGAGMGMFSIGYVFWALRGGAVITALASSVPAWRLIDPTAMLTAYRGAVAIKERDLDSLIGG